MTASRRKHKSNKGSKASKQSKGMSLGSSSSASLHNQVSNTQESLDADSFWQNESTLAIMDLQAYFLLASDLLNKVEVDHSDDETIDQIKQRLWAEWRECYPIDFMPPNVSRTLASRLKLIMALKHLDTIKYNLDDESPESRKKVANTAKDLIDLLSSKFAPGKFMNSSVSIHNLVELKSLFVVYELASGVEEDNAFRSYRKLEAKAFIESEFQLATLSEIPPTLKPRVSVILSDRLQKIKSLVETDGLSMEDLNFSKLDDSFRQFFARIFEDANASSLPELHPNYKENLGQFGANLSDEYQMPFDNDQVAHILSVMRGIESTSGTMNLEDLDSFLNGEAWPHTNKRIRDRKNASQTDGMIRKSRTGGAWTVEETDALEKGMKIFRNDWKAIKEHFKDTLFRRTNVNLKDRARNVKRKRLKEGLPLGIWELACG